MGEFETFTDAAEDHRVLAGRNRCSCLVGKSFSLSIFRSPVSSGGCLELLIGPARALLGARRRHRRELLPQKPVCGSRQLHFWKRKLRSRLILPMVLQQLAL
jgi:hypothetical protein